MTKYFNDVELTPSSMAQDMVESRNELDQLIVGVSNVRITKLRKEFLEEDLLAIQFRRGWKKLSEEEKIECAVCEADFAIMKWHVKLIEEGKGQITFLQWSKELKERFQSILMTEGQYARLSQRKGEKLSEYIVRMEDLGETLGIEEKRRFSFFIEGIDKEYWVIKAHIISEEKMSNNLMRKIVLMEKDFLQAQNKVDNRLKLHKKEYIKKQIICFICNGEHYASACPDHPRKEKISKGKRRDVNEVDENVRDFAINKSDFIYIGKKKYMVVLDTGAEENYISKELSLRLGLLIKKVYPEKIRYAVDGRCIKITESVDLEFFHERKKCKANLFVLPGSRKDKLLLGRRWIKAQNGRDKYECSIITPPGKRVVEATWTLPHKLIQGVNKAIKDYEEKGYIRDSKSTWASNIRPVEKPDGSVRIATNLVALNKLVELDKYSLPNMDQILFSLHGNKWFSKIDLKDGFFQIPLREEDKHKTAFRHEHRLKEWNVMPMGFKNAPAVFQRYMDHVLAKELGKSCWCYVDDILIFGKDEVEHDDNLKRVKSILLNHCLEINEKKSQYKKLEMEFLGHWITEGIVKKQLDNQEAIINYPSPKSVKEVQSFLGLVNHYRKFIKNVTELCKPLFELLKKDNEFVWKAEHEKAFEKLKTVLLEPTVLHQPDHSKTFILETDACNTGLGAILSQEVNGEEVPIAYASRMLQGAEINYSISEKECLGAIYGMEKFKYYLYGQEFVLRTDHKALEKLNSGPLKSARIERWCERLQNFTFHVEYRKGESIPHVDALSRTIRTINEIEELNSEKDKLILRTHETMIHRGAKAIVYRLAQTKGIKVSEEEVRQAIKNCYVCKMFNPKRTKGYKHIKAFTRGEKVGFDVMGPLKGDYIITAIDYFTREGFAKRIPTRESGHILKFLQEIHGKLGIKNLISDGASENCGSKIKEWIQDNGMVHHVTSAHHPQSNGRIERFNKTLLEGLRKGSFKGVLQCRLNKILTEYNNTQHEGLGVTPNEAKLSINWDKIRLKTFEEVCNKYSDKFKKGAWEKLEKNQRVLIKTEVGRKKDHPLFKEQGEIEEVLENDSYYIKRANGRTIKRHISQLKLIENEVVNKSRLEGDVV